MYTCFTLSALPFLSFFAALSTTLSFSPHSLSSQLPNIEWEKVSYQYATLEDARKEVQEQAAYPQIPGAGQMGANAGQMPGNVSRTDSLVQGEGSPSPSASRPMSPGSSVVLPPGWEECMDPTSGRVFYKNHVTRTTQVREGIVCKR